MRKHVLVTGANGQLGMTLRNLASQYPDLDFTFLGSKELDITNSKQLQHCFSKNRFDYCINCAAYTAVDRAESEPEKAYAVNAEGVLNLALNCKDNAVILLHVSTDFVFDGTKTTPYKETDHPNPINVYGASKLKGEEYIKGVLENYYILRTSWVYSLYGNNFVKTMLRLAKEKKELKVVNDQIGSPTFAGDLAEAILNMLTTETLEYGTYHYSNEGGVSWFEFAKGIFEVKGINQDVLPISTDEFLTKAKRPMYSVLDLSAILNSGFEVKKWKDALYRCLK